ncbi:hypothetical protein [Shewanella algae]|uniref:hypothetical protein n=1 Tax=Shewanella algae TaxID=38313 RepID=UPI0025521900|nr:hypothetical protein [Shewanella algae]MDL2195580.1 hypothetical protein [Shewanella algae]
MNRETKFAITVILVIATIALAGYAIRYHDMPFSKNSQDWANFGTYISGILTPLAGFAIFIQIGIQQREQRIRDNEAYYQQIRDAINIGIQRVDSLIDAFDSIPHPSPNINRTFTRMVNYQDNSLKDIALGFIPPIGYSVIIPQLKQNTHDTGNSDKYRIVHLLAENLNNLYILGKKLPVSDVKNQELQTRYQHLCNALNHLADRYSDTVLSVKCGSEMAADTDKDAQI